MTGTSEHSAHPGGLCVVVTPPSDAGGPTPIPEPVVDALTHNGATIEHAASVYHAAARMPRALREASHTKLALLFVEPERIPEADTLCLAAQSQFRPIAVWRYSASSGVALAPYSPARSVTMELDGFSSSISVPTGPANLRLVGAPPAGTPQDDEPEHEGESANGARQATPEQAEPASEPSNTDGAERLKHEEPEPPLVSQDELSMLLGYTNEERP